MDQTEPLALESYTAAGVLPYCFLAGDLLFLIGKEKFYQFVTKKGCLDTEMHGLLWSDFGGKKEPQDQEIPERTASREFAEETFGMFGGLGGSEKIVQKSAEEMLNILLDKEKEGKEVFKIINGQYVMFLAPVTFVDDLMLNLAREQWQQEHGNAMQSHPHKEGSLGTQSEDSKRECADRKAAQSDSSGNEPKQEDYYEPVCTSGKVPHQPAETSSVNKILSGTQPDLAKATHDSSGVNQLLKCLADVVPQMSESKIPSLTHQEELLLQQQKGGDSEKLDFAWVPAQSLVKTLEENANRSRRKVSLRLGGCRVFRMFHKFVFSLYSADLAAIVAALVLLHRGGGGSGGGAVGLPFQPLAPGAEWPAGVQAGGPLGSMLCRPAAGAAGAAGAGARLVAPCPRVGSKRHRLGILDVSPERHKRSVRRIKAARRREEGEERRRRELAAAAKRRRRRKAGGRAKGEEAEKGAQQKKGAGDSNNPRNHPWKWGRSSQKKKNNKANNKGTQNSCDNKKTSDLMKQKGSHYCGRVKENRRKNTLSPTVPAVNNNKEGRS